jgi:hypothetical protein
MLNFYGLGLAPKSGKRIPSNFWEANLQQPLGPNVSAFINILIHINVLAFISNLGSNNKPKMLNVGPKFFQALTPRCTVGLKILRPTLEEGPRSRHQ